MFLALQLFLSAATVGLTGSGKTKICKDFAKALGKKSIIFNCSDSLDYKSVGKFFKVKGKAT